jgi:hypothetical protein
MRGKLDGADGHMAEKESAEDASTGSGEEMQFTKWNIHAPFLPNTFLIAPMNGSSVFPSRMISHVRTT